MALFKIFRGNETDLTSVPMHEGYAYFTEDKGNLFIDVNNEPGGRLQVNAYAAQILRNADGSEIDIDDIFLKNMVATVKQGGTGKNSLTVNALLIGNGTNPIKMVALEQGQIAVGDSVNGITGLTGSGVLFSLTAGSPQFGIAPIGAGGTGANSATGARTNLVVYSKTEVDNKIGEVTSVAYTTTLYASGWIANGDTFTYSYTNSSLACGKAGNVPPIITPTSNVDEYSKITQATATPKTGIVFTIPEKPSSDIGIIIVDNK